MTYRLDHSYTGPLLGLRVRDTFAGGVGGWDTAAAELGAVPDGWENSPIAVKTRDAIGHRTVGANVEDLRTFPGEYAVELSSPVCTGFSIAGQGRGRDDLLVVKAGIQHLADGWPADEVRAYVKSMASDVHTSLVLEPLRIALEGQATYLAWEQVPTVLPIWHLCRPVLESRGYSVATGVLNADEYGVPQTRKRAILVARRDGIAANLPRPTHIGYPHGGRGGGLWPNPRWVSMADALGWGMTHRPSMTVSAGGTGSGGGLEIFGNGARRGMRAEWEAGRWLEDEYEKAGHSRWSATGKSIRLSTQDVLALQSFDPETPVQGLIGQRSTQVGNAVPRLMARAILEALVKK